ncbi:MAG: hypothetical protein ROZ64_04895 [Burkholderiaceae bacterium]|nr:hypothetical protein [Burkholderiaceae bacterium]
MSIDNSRYPDPQPSPSIARRSRSGCSATCDESPTAGQAWNTAAAKQFEDLIVVNDPVTAERVPTLDDHPLPSLGVMYRGGQRAERVSRRA